MLIGIDGHNLEGQRTGVGRYLYNLLKEWEMANRKSQTPPPTPFKKGEGEGGGLVKFILYFKDEIPNDLPESGLFEKKLLGVSSTAKFIHWDLCRTAKNDKIDILFCPGYIGPLFWKGKIALTLHDISYEAHPEWFNWSSVADKILLKWVSKKTARKADAIFVPVNFVKEEVIKFYKVPEEKIIVTGEGVDPALLGEIDDDELVEIKKKFAITHRFIFYVGSVFSRRHLKEVISAFKRLDRNDFQLVLAGRDYTENKQVDQLSEVVNKELSRQAILRVDFANDSDLKLLYRACAFFVWLSDYEGFGLPVLEAMSLGTPVITSDSSSLKEVAGEAALLIKNNFDVEEIFQAMRKMIEDNALKLQLIEKGREQAKKFSWERCAEETLKALVNA